MKLELWKIDVTLSFLANVWGHPPATGGAPPIGVEFSRHPETSTPERVAGWCAPTCSHLFVPRKSRWGKVPKATSIHPHQWSRLSWYWSKSRCVEALLRRRWSKPNDLTRLHSASLPWSSRWIPAIQEYSSATDLLEFEAGLRSHRHPWIASTQTDAWMPVWKLKWSPEAFTKPQRDCRLEWGILAGHLPHG